MKTITTFDDNEITSRVSQDGYKAKTCGLCGATLEDWRRVAGGDCGDQLTGAGTQNCPNEECSEHIVMSKNWKKI